MKIAMIGHKRIPSREGGVEIVVGELSRRMVSLGNSVTAFNRKSEQARSLTPISAKKNGTESASNGLPRRIHQN